MEPTIYQINRQLVSDFAPNGKFALRRLLLPAHFVYTLDGARNT